MTDMDQKKIFGAAGNCSSLGEIVELIARNRSTASTRKLAAAYGMLLHASQAVRATSYFDDARHVVDQLSRAKTEIDIAAWHAPNVTAVTALVLSEAQEFLDQETIGNTEWPTPKEVSSIAAKAAIDQISET